MITQFDVELATFGGRSFPVHLNCSPNLTHVVFILSLHRFPHTFIGTMKIDRRKQIFN